MITVAPRQQQGRLVRIRTRLAEDDGWAGSALLYVGFFLLLLVGVQVALWFNGFNVAQAAAQSGYTVSRSYQSNADAGRATAQQLVDGIRGSLTDANITINRAPDTVIVTVSGRVATILPGLDGLIPPVTYTLTGPVERWVPRP